MLATKRQLMSKKRQTTILDVRGDSVAELTTLTYDYPPNHLVPPHHHREAQLVFASKGVMTIHASKRTWVVPPQKAVWIPPGESHSIQMSKLVSMRTLYFAPKLAAKLPDSCTVLHVLPLLRELVLHCCSLRKLSLRDHAPLIQTTLAQIESAKKMPLSIPHPQDPRARKIAEIVLQNPSDQRTLDQLCLHSGASKRTIERLFQSETGLNFGKWRQQTRLLHGVKLVGEGEKVTQAALDAGYNSPSAFISMFRKALGTTPSRYSSEVST